MDGLCPQARYAAAVSDDEVGERLEAVAWLLGEQARDDRLRSQV
jgi:hypothetical protein